MCWYVVRGRISSSLIVIILINNVIFIKISDARFHGLTHQFVILTEYFLVLMEPTGGGSLCIDYVFGKPQLRSWADNCILQLQRSSGNKVSFWWVGPPTSLSVLLFSSDLVSFQHWQPILTRAVRELLRLTTSFTERVIKSVMISNLQVSL